MCFVNFLVIFAKRNYWIPLSWLHDGRGFSWANKHNPHVIFSTNYIIKTTLKLTATQSMTDPPPDLNFKWQHPHFYFHYPTTVRYWKYRFRSEFSMSSFHLIYMFWVTLCLKKWFLEIGLMYVCVYVTIRWI